MGYNMVNPSLPRNATWNATMVGVSVYVGNVWAGVWTPGQLRRGVNWTVPEGVFPTGPGVYSEHRAKRGL